MGWLWRLSPHQPFDIIIHIQTREVLSVCRLHLLFVSSLTMFTFCTCSAFQNEARNVLCAFFFVLCKSALCNRFLLSSALKNYLVSVFSFWCRQFSIPPLHRYFTCSSVLFAHLILCDVRLMSFETSNRVQVFLIGRIFFSAVSSYLLVMKCIFSATEKPNAW